MSTDLASKNGGSTAISTTSNPYTEFGLPASTIRGKLLKYVKGKWKAGQNDEPVPLHTKFVAVLDEMTAGYLKWENKRPVDQRMVKVSEGPKPSRRECGDNDRGAWPIDLKTGKPKDPWQETVYLYLVDAKGNIFTYSPSSAGGIGACRKLSTEYGKALLKDPKIGSDYPLITLETDSYDHEEYGEIDVPVLAMRGLVPKATVAAAFAAGVNEPEDEEIAESENPGYGVDEEIPF